jgi:predicted PurR-regulated permease PerM
LPVRNGSVRVLAVVAVLAAIYVTRDLTGPVLVALVLYLLLAPVVAFARSWRIPSLLSAGVLVLGLFVLISGPVLATWQSASGFLNNLPEHAAEVKAKIADWGVAPDLIDAPSNGPAAAEVVEAVDGELSLKVEVQEGAGGNRSAEAMAAAAAETVVEATEDAASGLTQTQDPTLEEAAPEAQWMLERAVGPLLAQTQRGLVAIMVTLLMTFFLLASGRSLLNRVLQLLEDFHDKRGVVAMMGDLTNGVSMYLLTLTAINVVFGVVAGLIFWLCGVPSAALWGVGAALCNFVPYLGPIVFMFVFLPSCLLAFDTLTAALIPPGLFVVLNILEAYVIGPHVYGHRLSLHPLIVFVGLLSCAWLWGIAGALIAVPLVMCVNLVCLRFESLRWISTLLCGDVPDLPSPPAGTRAKAV